MQLAASHLGHAAWRDVAGRAISIEGDYQIAKQLRGGCGSIKCLAEIFIDRLGDVVQRQGCSVERRSK
jgi:hypothetical protein